MKMIRMAVRYPNVRGALDRVALGCGDRPVETPAAEIAGSGQPRVGGEHGTAVVVKDQRRIPKGFEPHFHWLASFRLWTATLRFAPQL